MSQPAAETRPTGGRLLLAPRHSRAALRAAANRSSQRSILIALVANVAVAGAKLAAGLITGSSALLAEAAHSAADSVNEVLLGLSLRRARRPADAAHPFGYGATRFLWAFLAAIFSFLVGGCVSVALAVHELLHASAVDQFLIGWIVLGVAFAADGTSLLASLATTRREAALWNQRVVPFLRVTSDPTLRALVVEDTAALVGVALAAARLEVAYGIIEGSPAVDAVLSAYGVHSGPQEVIVAAKVRPKPGQTSEQLATAFDEIDRALRERLPEVAEVYLDPTSHSPEE
jgi:divalent metal cation (Fe/Co/Zn/Cd) transporter